MYSRYLHPGTFVQQPSRDTPKVPEPPCDTPKTPEPPCQPPAVKSAEHRSAALLPLLSRLHMDSSDLLIILLLLLLKDGEDNSTMLTAIALYFLL